MTKDERIIIIDDEKRMCDSLTALLSGDGYRVDAYQKSPEALEVIKTPNVALETSAANAPGVVRPVGEDDFLHVIMPMHLG